MKISINLRFYGTRVAVLAAVLMLCGGLVGLALMRFVAAVVANPGYAVSLPAIEAAAAYLPNSARVQARLAARLVESELDGTQSYEMMASRAFQHASRAVELAPLNYNYRVLLAAAAELQGNLAEAESALRAALVLAPNNVHVRWQMANLLLRADKADQALTEFRAVAAADPSRLPVILNLVWQAAPGDWERLNRVVSDSPQARLALAHFLVRQTKFDAAAQVFSRMERNNRLQSPESGKLLDAFLQAGQWQWAGKLWRSTVANESESDASLLWNGSFERPSQKWLTHFDWQLTGTNQARFSIAAGRARTGQRALKLTYLGVETTRIENEAQQLLLVRPGSSYRLECFARPEKLVAAEGPQVAVLRPDNRAVIAATPSVVPGGQDWQMLTVDFVVPADLHAVLVAIKQTPRYSYVEPPQGVVWLDDFSLHSL